MSEKKHKIIHQLAIANRLELVVNIFAADDPGRSSVTKKKKKWRRDMIYDNDKYKLSV